MKILDRYVLITFIKNYLISLMVLLGLYIVLDMVFNFDELAEAGQRTQLLAAVRDVSQTNGQIRANLTLGKNDTAAPGTEFKILDVNSKTIGNLTVETASGREVRGMSATPSPTPFIAASDRRRTGPRRFHLVASSAPSSAITITNPSSSSSSFPA